MTCTVQAQGTGNNALHSTLEFWFLNECFICFTMTIFWGRGARREEMFTGRPTKSWPVYGKIYDKHEQTKSRKQIHQLTRDQLWILPQIDPCTRKKYPKCIFGPSSGEQNPWFTSVYTTQYCILIWIGIEVQGIVVTKELKLIHHNFRDTGIKIKKWLHLIGINKQI